MARGKNKAISERRKEALQEIGSVEALQARIKVITEENENLKRQAEKTHLSDMEKIAEMTRRLEENTSQETESLQEQVDRLSESIKSLSEEYDKVSGKWRKAFVRMATYIAENENISNAGAMERVANLMGDNPNDIILDIGSYAGHIKGDPSLVPEKAFRLQRIRGVR